MLIFVKKIITIYDSGNYNQIPVQKNLGELRLIGLISLIGPIGLAYGTYRAYKAYGAYGGCWADKVSRGSRLAP